MKQFNLEEYLANPSRKMVTRDGRKVKRVLCTDVKGKYPIVVVIENHDGNTERAISLTKDGKYYDGSSYKNDLFFVPEKHEGWINVYRNAASRIYDSEEQAKYCKDNKALATIKIEWEEQI